MGYDGSVTIRALVETKSFDAQIEYIEKQLEEIEYKLKQADMGFEVGDVAKLEAQYEKLKNEIDNNIKKVLDDGHYIMGEEVKILEAELARYVGTTSTRKKDGTNGIFDANDSGTCRSNWGSRYRYKWNESSRSNYSFYDKKRKSKSLDNWTFKKKANCKRFWNLCC